MDLEHQDLEQVIASIQKQWGGKALQTLAALSRDGDGISTGFPTLDSLLGKGGIQCGTTTCLWGVPTAGMTTLVLNTIAQVQAAGEVAVYIDPDGTFDAEYARQRQLDLQRLLLVRPQPRELALDIARDIVLEGGAGIIVFDLGMAQTSADRAVLSKALRRLHRTVVGSAYAFIAIVPALPDLLGTILMQQADVRLRITWCRWVHTNRSVTGYEALVTVLKNKSAPDGQTTTITVSLDEGQRSNGT